MAIGTRLESAIVSAALVVAVLPAAHAGQRPVVATPGAAVAKVGGATISATQLDEWVGNGALALATQMYEVKRRTLEERIGKLLLEEEAARRKVSVAELERVEIEQKVLAVTPEEARAVYDATQDQFRDASQGEAAETIASRMKTQRTARRRAELLKELETKHGVQRLLEPPRVIVAEGDAPSKGSKTAPVSIVIFSDFQCPYCVKARTTVKQIEQKYGEQVRFVYRDFPLPMHQQAPKAAEAGRCAHDQGKFWEMYDKLYDNATNLEVAALKRYAAEVGLDGNAFGECLDSGRHAAEWGKDRAEGESYGIKGTPAFLVNGRFLQGARPLEAFAELIDEELARSAPPHGKASQP
jgi:protein-disulfide isomerase